MAAKRLVPLAFAGFLTLMGQPASNAAVVLEDWGLNLDGQTYCAAGCTVNATGASDLPSSVGASGFDFMSGLGSLLVTITGAGSHNVDFFVDHDIDEAVNTFFNEFGASTGASAAGQSAEIDEPGFRTTNPGDIFDNFLASILDNTNAVPAGSEDDVSMALGWDFTLAALETATISFLISEIAPVSGFYLSQTDPDSDATIYFSSSLNIGLDPPVPASSAAPLALLTAGLFGFGFSQRRANQTRGVGKAMA